MAGQETTFDEFPPHPLASRNGNCRMPHSESGVVHMGDITGGTPYGATTIAGLDGSRQPNENEPKIARYQGKHHAELATKLFR